MSDRVQIFQFMINRLVDSPSGVHMKDCVGDAESSIQEEEETKESHSSISDLDTEWAIDLISLRGRQFATEEESSNKNYKP